MYEYANILHLTNNRAQQNEIDSKLNHFWKTKKMYNQKTLADIITIEKTFENQGSDSQNFSTEKYSNPEKSSKKGIIRRRFNKCVDIMTELLCTYDTVNNESYELLLEWVTKYTTEP